MSESNMNAINYAKGSRKLKSRFKFVPVKKADAPNPNDLRQIIGRTDLFKHTKSGLIYKITTSGRVYLQDIVYT